jgi:adenylate cyclase
VVVGLLEIDTDVSVLLQRLRSRLWIQALIGFAALAIALLLSFVMAHSLTRSVTQLITAVGEVEAGHYDVQVSSRSKDEMGVLALAFNSMLRGLRERLAMLRFVPRHTRAVIAEAVREHAASGDAFIARKKELAVLFSDIRGFTSLSDELPPDRVIAMLNSYLRRETEIVEGHSGSVDKFIGDAVMAIFEGPERFSNAASAALAIQTAMGKLNADKAFERPIEVGIGIAGGEVVMGSVGSEDRMELAIIGRLTNLASRLTSAAGRGEVLVSELAFQALGGLFEGERVEGLHLKGFAQDQTCYRLLHRKKAAQGAPPTA